MTNRLPKSLLPNSPGAVRGPAAIPRLLAATSPCAQAPATREFASAAADEAKQATQPHCAIEGAGIHDAIAKRPRTPRVTPELEIAGSVAPWRR